MNVRRSTDRMCRSHTARTLCARFTPSVPSSVRGRSIGRNVHQSGRKTGVSSVSAVIGCRRPVAFPSRVTESAKLRRTRLSDNLNAPRIFPSDFKALADRIFFNSFIVQRHESQTVLVVRLLCLDPAAEIKRGDGQLRRRY